MGVIISSVLPFDYDSLGKDAKLQELSGDDILAIQNTWKLVKGNPEVGIQTMIRIFTAHTSIRHVWVFASNLETGIEIRTNAQVVYHAGKIMATLNLIISNLDARLSKHKEMLLTLGVKHYAYNVKPVYFKDFYESFIFALEMTIFNERVFNKRTRDAWSKLILLIADFISTGIRIGEERANQETKLTATTASLRQNK